VLRFAHLSEQVLDVECNGGGATKDEGGKAERCPHIPVKLQAVDLGADLPYCRKRAAAKRNQRCPQDTSGCLEPEAFHAPGGAK